MKDELEEKQVQRYLLGELPETEAAALEERWFADEESFERAWESENRLVDDYVRGRLARAERGRFESHYLASPVHRRRVEAARRLLAAADAPEAALSMRERIAGWWRFSPVPRFAMAAGLLLLLGTTLWLLRERARMREELAARIAAERVERERHAAELDRLRSGQTPPPASPEPAPAPLRTQTVVAFLLSPTSVRGGAAQPLRLPAGVDQAQLRLRVAPDEGRRFEAGLQTADGESVWRGRNLAARSGFVAITIPAARLPHNDYVLILSSIDSDGRAEELRRYSFRVTRE